MKKFFKIAAWMLAMATLMGLPACQKTELDNSADMASLKKADMNTFYSASQPIGNGVGRAFIMVDKWGNPKSIGVNLSEKALMNLPDEVTQFVFEFPKTKSNFFMHALVDWNPQGHEPEHVYDVPHFDFHFYIISSAERMAIPFMDPASYMDPAPDMKYIPANYIELPGLVPEMGAHWVDVTSPELNGTPFTYTFIWGSYSGHFIFWEPMITRDYLMSMPNDTIPIPQPSAYEKTGYYASHYVIKYSDKPGQYTIALTNLWKHEGE